VPYRVPPVLDRALFHVYGSNFHAYRGFMLVISVLMFVAIWLLLTRTRIGLVIQAALTHPEMVGALGHNVPRVFTIVFAGGSVLAGLAGVIGGNYLVTEPSMAATMGPIVFVVVVFGGLGSLAGCFIASLIMGLVQTFAVVIDVSLADLLARLGIQVTSATPLAEVLTMPLPRVGALLPYLMLILVLLIKPRGLMGTRDT
jgi:branched-chain amino acid transport system permease protein